MPSVSAVIRRSTRVYSAIITAALIIPPRSADSGTWGPVRRRVWDPAPHALSSRRVPCRDAPDRRCHRAAAIESLVAVARVIDWKAVLTVVQPETLIRGHRAGWRLFWCWTSRPCGRPRIPRNLQQLIVAMARANPTWGEERIARDGRFDASAH